MSSKLYAFKADRDALMRNPTLEAAIAFRKKYPMPGLEVLSRPDVPLAAVHKGRLQWLHATDAMMAESEKWLRDNGYAATFKGGMPLTPSQRDLERVRRGLLPLAGVK